MAEYILSDYISKALARPVYEKLGDGTHAGGLGPGRFEKRPSAACN